MQPVMVRGGPRRLRITQQGQVVDEQGNVASPSQDEAKQLLGFGGQPTQQSAQQQDESWRTLAPRRDVPQTYKDAADIPRGAGNFVQVGERYAPNNLDDLMRLGAAGDPAAARRALEESKLRARGQLGGHFSPEQLAQNQARAMADFEAAMGMAQKGFDADTQRGLAGVEEYRQKVRGPQQEASAAQLEREKMATQKEIAQTTNKATMQLPLIQAAVKKMEGGSTPGEVEAFVRAAGDLQSKFREEARPKVGVQGPGSQVSVLGGSPGKSRQETLDDERQVTAFLQAIGARPGQDGKAVPFRAETMVAELARNPALANNPTVREALARGAGGKSVSELSEEVFNAFNRYAGIASGAHARDFKRGLIGGAGLAGLAGLAARPRNPIDAEFGGVRYHHRPGFFRDTEAMTFGPESQVIRAIDVGNAPFNAVITGQRQAVPWTPHGEANVRQAADRARAMGPLVLYMNELLRQRQGGR